MKKERLLFVSLLLLFLFWNKNTSAQKKIIKKGDIWYYFDNGYLKNDWYRHIDLNKWKKGVTSIGYGDSKIVTTILYGGNSENKEITKYFTKDVSLKNISKYLSFEIQFQRDDGIVIYINGKELFRNNMPKGIISGKSTAENLIDGKKESTIHTKIINNSVFKKGINTISVSIHQYSKSSSDCIFSLELLGHTDLKTLNTALKKQILDKEPLNKKVHQLSNELLIEKKNLHIELLKNNNENLRYTLFIVGFLLFIALIGYFLLLKYQEQKQNANNKKFIKLKDLNLEKEKELMTLSTRLLHNRQNFKEIKIELKGLKTEEKTTVKNIIQQIDNLLDKDQDWKILEKHFNEVFSGFYNSVLKAHPSLSETELRHCMFIKLHMQTKEIAKTLMIDPRSVQTARYRIKKKMNLGENIDLRDYLLNL